MYAIIETGGKQYKVQPGDVVFVEKLPGEVGEKVEFDQVLALKDNDQLQVGTPYIEGARVVAKVLEQDKHKKILVFKYKAKSNYRRRYGHRQPYTRVLVEEIIG
ncbi:MAG TPA: 50S ribosomal protein L21 [Firmicutes bacterium]|jgi:large subunit ribosomal protein L21|nr:50S ribosomal protein L21 [Bacillota bacterium]